MVFAFVLTVAATRWVSWAKPGFHYDIRGIHIHHYMYGIFIITFAGYCALVLKGPKSTFWIALLFGWGAGWTFDEMGMWINSHIDPTLRWDHKGWMVGILALAAAGLSSNAIIKRNQNRRAEVVLDLEFNRLEKGPIDIETAGTAPPGFLQT